MRRERVKGKTIKKWTGLALCMILVVSMFALTACNDDKKDGAHEPDPGDKISEQAVKLYFANTAYINTGVETPEVKMMMPAYDYKLMVEADDKPASIYEDTLDALQFAPNEEYITILTDQIEPDKVYVKGETAYVDMDGKHLMGGNLEETILINQIVCTLVDSFPEIKNVQFLVNGKNVNTLMGQMDTTRPFTKGENGVAIVVE
ncbi:MAG: GerMN domain-containing protein [Anaerovorax sp.]